MTAPVVDVRAWNAHEPLALVDGVVVRVERMRGGTVRWRCRSCGSQTNRPRCPHTRALAATPVPAQPQPQEGATP